jgi:hypothetical protein
MSDPYSVRLGVITVVSGTVGDVGTVPAGKRWVVRDITFTQVGTGTCRGYLRIAAVDGRLAWSGQLAQNSWERSDQRHCVVNAGETLRVQATDITGAITLSVQVNGYELDVP